MKSPGSQGHILAGLLLGFALAAHAQWDVPEEMQAAVDGLSDEQSEFVTSGTILNYIPERQLEHELLNREADSLASFIDDLMSLHDQMAYDPEEDMGAIPLNLTTDNFNQLGTAPKNICATSIANRDRSAFIDTCYPKSGVPTFRRREGRDLSGGPGCRQRRRRHCRRPEQHEQRSPRRRECAGSHAGARYDFATPDIQSLIKPLKRCRSSTISTSKSTT